MDRHAIEDRAVQLAGQDPDSDRAAAELVEMAGGRRGPLEEVHRHLVMRLHRRSDDFEATNALRLVSRALQQVGHGRAGYPSLAGVRPSRHRVRRLLSGRTRSPRVPKPRHRPAAPASLAQSPGVSDSFRET